MALEILGLSQHTDLTTGETSCWATTKAGDVPIQPELYGALLELGAKFLELGQADEPVNAEPEEVEPEPPQEPPPVRQVRRGRVKASLREIMQRREEAPQMVDDDQEPQQL